MPPAIHAPAHAIDCDRILSAILHVEQNPWSRAGGAFGFLKVSWYEDADMDFRFAKLQKHAWPVARKRVSRFLATCAKLGLRPEPINIADMWRHGFDTAIARMRSGSRFAAMDYAQRATNLYNDRSF